jgi:hypothetical protein
MASARGRTSRRERRPSRRKQRGTSCRRHPVPASAAARRAAPPKLPPRRPARCRACWRGSGSRSGEGARFGRTPECTNRRTAGCREPRRGGSCSTRCHQAGGGKTISFQRLRRAPGGQGRGGASGRGRRRREEADSSGVRGSSEITSCRPGRGKDGEGKLHGGAPCLAIRTCTSGTSFPARCA